MHSRSAARIPLLLLLLVPLLASACGSPLKLAYGLRGYGPSGPDTIKHVALLAWAPTDTPKLAELLARETADVLRLRRNYLVHAVAPMRQSWAEACRIEATASGPALELQGVIAVRLLDAVMSEGKVAMTLSMELYRCADGALVSRSEAKEASDPAEADLQLLVSGYVAEFGALAEQHAAAAFILIKTLVDALPNPVLTDDEIEQKIELEA